MARGNTSEGSKTNYFSVSHGLFKLGGSADDTTNPDHRVIEYKNKEGEDKESRGVFYNTISGKIQSVYFRENDYGEFLNIYIQDEDVDGLDCIQFKYDSAWGAYNTIKRALIALMIIDRDEEVVFRLNSFKQEGSDFKNIVLSVKQNGKSLVLNPMADESTFDESKQIEMPYSVQDELLAIDVPTKEERAKMSKTQKGLKRLQELEEIKALFETKYQDILNSEYEKSKNSGGDDEGEPNTDVPQEHQDDDEPETRRNKKATKADKPKEPEMSERERKIAELKARRNKSKNQDE